MNTKQALKNVLWTKKVSQQEVAKKLGTLQQAVSKRINMQKPSVKVISELLRACGYKMVFVPEETDLKADWFEID